jgi:DNA adenine methylase
MRYSGSKAKIAKYIIPFIVKELKPGFKYVEPFVGGCNVIDKVDWENKVGYDNNHYVISLWGAIRNGLACNIPKEVTETQYAEMKELAKVGSCSITYPRYIIGYVGNACSYGSAWFNGYAKTNEKRGENHMLEAYNNLFKQIHNFKHLYKTYFTCGDYKDAFQVETSLGENKNVVFYCDPPYRGTKGYKGKEFDSDEFWNFIRKYAKLGYKIFVSEYEAPDDFKCIWSMEKKDGMGTTKCGCKQKTKVERLFVYDNSTI